MSIQEQVLQAVMDEIDSLHLCNPAVIGPLSQGNGPSCLPSGGSAVEATLAHGGTYTANFALNWQHADQSVVRDVLCTIHEHLNKLADYPKGDGWAVCRIETLNFPEYIDRTEQLWVYGSSVAVEYVID